MLSSFLSSESGLSSGGTITGDLTISGDLTVEGGGGFSYSEVLTGDMKITNADTTIGLEIDQNGNSVALKIENTGNQNQGLYVYSGMDGNSAEPLVAITADHPAFDQPVLNVYNDGVAEGIKIDQNNTGDSLKIDHDVVAASVAASNTTVFHLDFDRATQDSGTAAHNDIGFDLDVSSSSKGTSTAIGMDIDVVGAGTGTQTATGLTVDVSGGNTNYAALFNGGNVGIGTSAPSRPLEITSSGDGTQINANTNHIVLGNASATPKWYQYLSGNDLRFYDSADRLTLKSGGNVGIGTATSPHGGVGAAKLSIEGTNGSTAGPHVQYTTPSDDYPLFQQLNWTHDAIYLLFDAYWDGAWKSSDAGSNFMINKSSDSLQFQCDTGISVGSGVTWATKFKLDDNSRISLSNNDAGGTGGSASTSGNTVFGYLSGQNIEDGCIDNTFIGHNVAIATLDNATNNVGIGGDVFVTMTTADSNTAVGKSALYYNSTANYNSVLGHAAGFYTQGASNTYIGYFAGKGTAGAETQNVGVGASALLAVTTASYNVAVGGIALDALTIGGSNVAVGYNALSSAAVGESSNIAIGESAMASADEGTAGGDIDKNIAIGVNAFTCGDLAGNDRQVQGNIAIGANAVNSTGANAMTGTIGIGHEALTALTSGARNTAVGYQAMDEITVGEDNVAFGYGALGGASTSSENKRNVAIGASSMSGTNAGAAQNVAIGYAALDDNLTSAADNNTAIGNYAGSAVTSGADNVIVGSTAGDALTTGNANVLIGMNAGGNFDTEEHNVAIGRSAMAGAHSAAYCVAVGGSALQGAATIDGTVAIGYNALNVLTSGEGNVAIGYQALDAEVTGDYSTAVGHQALTAQTGIDGNAGNTAVGWQAGLAVGDGQYNTLIGKSAGDLITTGDYNTCLGIGADVSANSATNQTVIGGDCTGVIDNSVTLGNADVTRVYMSQDADAVMYADGTINTSDERFKKDIEDSDLGLSFINSVRPVKYKFKSDKRGSKSKYGIIAQEVIEVLKTIDKEDFAGIETGDPDKLGADYIQFVAPLIKAVQELTAKVEALEKK